MTNPKNSAERICDLLFFRGLLEILKIMMQSYNNFFETKEEEMVNYLIEMFDQDIKIPEKLFSLNLNDKEGGKRKKQRMKKEEKARNLIIEKVEKFLDDYIKGKINVFIQRLATRRD